MSFVTCQTFTRQSQSPFMKLNICFHVSHIFEGVKYFYRVNRVVW